MIHLSWDALEHLQMTIPGTLLDLSSLPVIFTHIHAHVHYTLTSFVIFLKIIFLKQCPGQVRAYMAGFKRKREGIGHSIEHHMRLSLLWQKTSKFTLVHTLHATATKDKQMSFKTSF